jgi:hypothetical protein
MNPSQSKGINVWIVMFPKPKKKRKGEEKIDAKKKNQRTDPKV